MIQMKMDILRYKRRHEPKKEDFCSLLEGYKKIHEQDDIVTESKGVEYTPMKLYENKTRT